MRSLRCLCAVIAAAAALAASPLAASATTVTLPTGQTVSPAGRITPLAAFPTAVAVSPDGSELVVIAGAALASDGPPVLVELIDAATGTVAQTLRVNDAFQSAQWSADGGTVYIAGGQDGAVHVFTRSGGAPFTAAADLTVPGCDFVSGIVLGHGGTSIFAACPLANAVHELAISGGAALRTFTAHGADELALSPDGGHLYATDWRGSTATVVDLRSGVAAAIGVGQHPDAVTVLPDGRAVVTDTNDATLATIPAPVPAPTVPGPTPVEVVGIGALVLLASAVLRRRRATLALAVTACLVAGLVAAGGTVLLAPRAHADAVAALRTDVGQVQRHGDAPNAIVASPSGDRLFVSLGADNAVAELVPNARPGDPAGPWRVAGLIPTGWYPVALALSPDGATLHVITARGLGNSAAATNPYVAPDPANTGINSAYATAGTLETLPVPDAATLARDTATVHAGLPVVAPASASSLLTGAQSPIKHVIYITRENKTYDADLGDLHPGPQNALVLFGRQNTPNLHELETTFSESQAFYYPGFRSTVGHMWEDAGGPSDVYERTAGGDTGGIAGDWGNPENYPSTGLLVSQVLRAGLTVRTYNEELAQQSTLVPATVQAPQSVFPNYDLHVSDTSREQGWETEFAQFESHHCTGVLAATYGADCQLPSLEYVYLGEDHTTVVDEPGYPTIEAQVADNDYATGRVVDAVSHSPDWASTLVVTVEDDPQGTGDDLSAYHGFIALASPYIKRGYISSVQYELPSVIGAIDGILGLPPLTDYVAEARPLDDLFTPIANLSPFTADASGIALYPFTPLPGASPAADPAHGIFSFALPDHTDPALAWRSTWMQLRGHPPPG